MQLISIFLINMEIIKKYENKPLFPILLGILFVFSDFIKYYIVELNLFEDKKRIKYFNIVLDFTKTLNLILH